MRREKGRGRGYFTHNSVWILCVVVCMSGCGVRSCGHSAEPPREIPVSQPSPAAKETGAVETPKVANLPRASTSAKEVSMVDRLEADVQQLATPVGRSVGTPGHDAARRYLVERINEAGLKPRGSEPFELPYEIDGTQFVNVIARLPGKNSSLPPIILAAHYDTCGVQPGADDNAAAIAIAFATVEPLRARQLERDVVYAFFDAEEPPYYLTPSMGSICWYNNQRTGPVHCAIAMDLVGHDVPIPGLEDVIALTGMESDPDLAQVVRACEPTLGLKTIPTLNRHIGDLSDHHVFRVNQRPYLFLTCAHSQDYHQKTDTPDKLNYVKMAAITEYLVNLMAAIDTKPLAGPFEGYDTTELELYFFRKTLGPLVSGLGFRLESRADIEAIIRVMQEKFGL